MAKHLLVLSDIDGTLVPHPYSSGIPSVKRAENVRRLQKLCALPNFGLITGRKMEGMHFLFNDAGLTFERPAVLGTEFGANLFDRHSPLLEHPQNPLIEALSAELQKIATEFDCIRGNLDDLKMFASGKLTSYVIELKKAILQMEWDFHNPAKDAEFLSRVSEMMNPLLTKEHGLYLQLFRNRLDVIEKGFVPKKGVWPRIRDSLIQNKVFIPQNTHLILLGDEIYDSYMFEDFLEFHSKDFAKISIYAVGRHVPHSHHVLTNTDEALTLLEGLLL